MCVQTDHETVPTVLPIRVDRDSWSLGCVPELSYHWSPTNLKNTQSSPGVPDHKVARFTFYMLENTESETSGFYSEGDVREPVRSVTPGWV